MNTPTRYGPHGKYVEVYGVESESKAGLIYTVARTAEDKWSCGCPRWTRNAARPECKHIGHIKTWRTRRALNWDTVPVAPMPEQVKKALGRFASIEV
jgi:hypothetical protein